MITAGLFGQDQRLPLQIAGQHLFFRRQRMSGRGNDDHRLFRQHMRHDIFGHAAVIQHDRHIDDILPQMLIKIVTGVKADLHFHIRIQRPKIDQHVRQAVDAKRLRRAQLDHPFGRNRTAHDLFRFIRQVEQFFRIGVELPAIGGQLDLFADTFEQLGLQFLFQGLNMNGHRGLGITQRS